MYIFCPPNRRQRSARTLTASGSATQRPRLSALPARLRARLRGVSPSSLPASPPRTAPLPPNGALCGRALPPQLPSPAPCRWEAGGELGAESPPSCDRTSARSSRLLTPPPPPPPPPAGADSGAPAPARADAGPGQHADLVSSSAAGAPTATRRVGCSVARSRARTLQASGVLRLKYIGRCGTCGQSNGTHGCQPW